MPVCTRYTLHTRKHATQTTSRRGSGKSASEARVSESLLPQTSVDRQEESAAA